MGQDLKSKKIEKDKNQKLNNNSQYSTKDNIVQKKEDEEIKSTVNINESKPIIKEQKKESSKLNNINIPNMPVPPPMYKNQDLQINTNNIQKMKK